MNRRINLLPPELAGRRQARARGASIAAAGLALIMALALAFGVQSLRVGREQDKLDKQEQQNDRLRAQVAQLAEFQRLGSELRSKTKLLSDLTEQEIRWSVVLADISLVIPSDVWLTQFTGTVTAEPDEGSLSVGQIELSGTTFSHVDVAKWLTQLARVDGFFAPYLSLSTKADIADTPVVNYTSSVQLSPLARRAEQRGAGRL